MTRLKFHKPAAIAMLCVTFGVYGTSVHAQSSVTLYGIIDGGLLYTSKTLNPTTGQNSGHRLSMTSSGMSPTLFGLSGTEDLGAGMKAIFKLESGFNVTNGGFDVSNGNMFGRQAWIGIESNYGTVKGGVQYSPFVLSIIATDPRSASYFASDAPIYIGSVGATGLFNSNAISYTSPTVAGFQGSAMLALGGVAGNFQAGRQYSASINYTTGSFMIIAAMYSGNAGGTAASTPVPSTVPFSGRTIGVSYVFENLTIKALYTNYKVAGSFDNRVYGGGASYQITPGLNADAGVWYTSDGNDTNNHSIMASTGLTYSLSKATAVYTQFGFVNNHGKMNTGLQAIGVPGSTFGAMVGMRHIF